MNAIVLELNARYELKLKDGTTVIARYGGEGIFYTDKHGYTLDNIDKIVRKMPG